MGRVIIILLVIATIVVLWKAFGPNSWGPGRRQIAGSPQPPQVKGPDDDEEFLWTLEKNRFKARRAAEEAAKQEEERVRRARGRYAEAEDPTAPAGPDPQGPQQAGQPDENPEKPEDGDQS